MQYKIVKQRRAWWPVKFPVVAEDGTVAEGGFEARFVLLDEDEFVAFLAASNDAPPPGQKVSQHAATAVARVMEDWRGVLTDDGTAEGASLPFSDENLALLLNQPNVMLAVFRAYGECRAGVNEVRAGN